MSESHSGYVEEIAYTFGYCDELNPVRLRLPLLRAGFALPTIHTACELGFGHGVSVNIHAAGSPSRWYGTDFNVAHANFARGLADSAESDAQLFGESFSEFCRRDDLPDFDFIGAHGIWSWVSEENRALIVEFINRKLKAGGVLYVSYNTQPGWTPMLPVRELMHQHFQINTEPESLDGTVAEGLTQRRIEAAVDFARAVFATQPGYALVNPMLAERVDALAVENSSYLAHEYFNRDWHPMTFSQVASSLVAAGLTYGGSADYRDHVDEINLNSAQRALLEKISDAGLRETVRDFCVNRSLRRDYWIKAPQPISDDQRDAHLLDHRVILAIPRASVVLKVRGALGEKQLPEALYSPILDALQSYRPMSLSDIENCVREQNIVIGQIVEAVTLLVGMGVLLNAQDDEQIAATRSSTKRLNAAICALARDHDEVQFLVSPVTASGILMPRVAQLFLLARSNHLQHPAQWAEFAETVLRKTYGTVGATAGPQPGTANSLTDLTAKANRFAQIHLPILQALEIA